MKKITLAMIGVASFVGGVFGQATISPTVPTQNSSTQLRLPNGLPEHKSLRGVMLLRQSDLSALTASNITGASFLMLDGTDPVSTVGSLTLYVQNTADVTNNKSALGFTGALAGMTVAANGNFNISTVAQTSIMPINGFTAFTYTGGGLYVAYAYEQTTPAVNTNTFPATWAANNAGTGNGLCATSNASVALGAPNTLTVTDFRPCIIFGAANTASNEISVEGLYAPGKVAKLFGQGHIVSAVVKNRSNISKSAITVSLGVTGANTFFDVQTIPALAAGASTVVNFLPFNPTSNGLNTMGVAISPDQNSVNNSQTWTQSVTCNEMGQAPPTATLGSAFGFGGTSGSGYFVTKYTVPSTASLTGIKFAVGNATQNSGKQIYGVLLDNTGTLISSSINTINISAAQLGSVVVFNFPNDQLIGGSSYILGVAQPSSGYYPMGLIFEGAFPAPIAYSVTALGGGGALNPITTAGGYFVMEPVLSFSNTTISASASKTVVCKTSPQQVTLTANGANSYTWSVNGLGNGSTAVYTPSAAGNATLTQVTVIGSYTSGAAQGCKSNSSSMLFSLSACTGVAENVGATAIKVMPNPAVAGKTNISNLSGVNTITVFNTLGQVIINRVSSNESESIDLSDFPSGNYLVRITDNTNEIRTVKIINQN